MTDKLTQLFLALNISNCVGMGRNGLKFDKSLQTYYKVPNSRKY